MCPDKSKACAQAVVNHSIPGSAGNTGIADKSVALTQRQISDPFPELPPPETDSCLVMAQWALAVGLRPIPIRARDDKDPGRPGKRPFGPGWGLRLHTSHTLNKLYRHRDVGGLGLLLGSAGGIIDVEVDDPIAAAPVIDRVFPDGVPPTMGYNSNKGPHWFFRYDPRLACYGTIIKGTQGDDKNELNPNYLGIELRMGAGPDSDEQLQSVIPPSLKNDGTRRRWNGNPHILTLPDSFFADLEQFGQLGGKKQRDDDDAPAPIKRVVLPDDIAREARLAEEALPYVQHLASDYSEWVKIGMALYSLEQEGLYLWDHWSQGDAKYQRGEARQSGAVSGAEPMPVGR